MTHKEYVEVLKNTLKILITKSTKTVIVAEVPILGIGLLGKLLDFVLNKIVGIILNQTELAVFLLYTDVRVSQQGKDFNEAALKNFKAQTEGDENDRKIAEQELVAAFRKFAKF